MSNPEIEIPQPDPTDEEPALKASGIVAAVGALVALAVSFGLPLTETQQAAIMTLATVAAPLVAGWLARRRVYSPATVARLLEGKAER